jgi:hypothetical protein
MVHKSGIMKEDLFLEFWNLFIHIYLTLGARALGILILFPFMLRSSFITEALRARVVKEYEALCMDFDFLSPVLKLAPDSVFTEILNRNLNTALYSNRERDWFEDFLISMFPQLNRFQQTKIMEVFSAHGLREKYLVELTKYIFDTVFADQNLAPSWAAAAAPLIKQLLSLISDDDLLEYAPGIFSVMDCAQAASFGLFE